MISWSPEQAIVVSMKRLLYKGLMVLIAGATAATLGLLPPTDSLAASRPADIEKANRQLFQAVHANDLQGVQTSVAAGANVEARDRWGLTPVEIAIDRGHYRIAHLLVSIRNLRRNQETTEHPPQATVATGDDSVGTAGGKPLDSTSPPNRPAPTGIDALPLAAGSPIASVWPTGKPNPFDPSRPAPGSQLRPSEPR